jgi:hypothetical protein
VKISRTGLLGLALLGFSALAFAQAPAQQPPAQSQPQETPQVETQRPIKLPPAPPEVVDIRMPGESGWSIGLIGWLPIGHPFVDKGHGADFTGLSKLQLAGTSKAAPGAEIGIAAGRHNSIRVSYFQSKLSGNTVAPTDLVIFSQAYNQGDILSTNSKLTDIKVSYEYLTWPFPVESRHFRLKTLWQAQYINMKSIFDAPVRSGTPDSNGNYTDYSTQGSKNFFTPSFGLGLHEYATRNLHFEANVSGFAWPHRFHLLDSDATVGYRFGKIELRAGAKSFLFRTSPKADYFYRGSAGGAYVGLRWFSD